VSGSNKIAISFVGSIVCMAFAVTTPFSVGAALAWGCAAFLIGVAVGTLWA
jgi:hypothetical protein